MGQGGQTERHCGKVRGHSDDLAPASNTLGVCVAGQVHDRRYRMRILHQLFALMAAADGGCGGLGVGCVGQQRGQG